MFEFSTLDINYTVVSTGTVNFTPNNNAPEVISSRAVPINSNKMYEIKLSTTNNIGLLGRMATNG